VPSFGQSITGSAFGDAEAGAGQWVNPGDVRSDDVEAILREAGIPARTGASVER
jgi:hypothetical protein